MYEIGHRYLHGKTLRPLTLRFFGCLPNSSSDTKWLGVEYDDPSHGKHSGVYQGTQVFHCRNEGAGSFLKVTAGALTGGKTFIEAIEDRYGGSESGAIQKVVLGGTDGIVVDAPGMEAVQRRIGRLEGLREAGLDGIWINGLGDGTAVKRRLVRKSFDGFWLILQGYTCWTSRRTCCPRGMMSRR
jgi:hypothetical protein